MICQALSKRNKQNPFDYQYAENFSLEGETDAMLNNSYYFSAHDEKMSVFARLGKRINMEETWFVIYIGGKVYSLQEEYFPVGASPIQVEKNGENWTVSYQGKLNETDEACLHANFIGKQKPIDFTSDMPAERMAAGIANEKWSKSFFGQLQNVSGQCHYEQEGVLEGQLTLNGKTTDFRLPCVRDHSFGKRDWNYMNNHLWLMAVSQNQQLNYSLVSYPVMSVLEVGQNDGVMKGVPVSNGECEGIVRVVYSIDDANKLQKGEIMVARFTDIGWTPYYSIVNGMITEIGSSLSHGAVVAREYGLPAIVNMKGATKLLKNGDRIRMDAGKGTVVLAEAS